MSNSSQVLNREAMRLMYGDFYHSVPKLRLNREKVPENFWPLLAYAEFWGISDDSTRESLIKHASSAVRHNLKTVVAAYDGALDAWLAGPEADDTTPSDEYVAFSAMRMAAYHA
jgi:hypothetical protein